MDDVRVVLVVEDNPGDARLIKEMFRDSGGTASVESAGTLAAAVERLSGADVDVVLLDLGLPDCQGLESFARLRDAAPGVAIVVLTGNSDISLAVSAVKEGAQDFLVKGRVDAELLTRAVSYAYGRQRADDAMVQEKAFLAKAEQIARLGSWRFDLATRRMWWSEEMHHIFGLDPECPPPDLVAAAESVIHPDDRLQTRRMTEDVIADGVARSTQYRMLMADGSVRWISAHTQQERDARGVPVAVAGFAQDISELKVAEERLAHDAALDRAVASLSEVIVTPGADRDDIASLVLGHATVLTGSADGFVCSTDPTTGRTEIHALKGSPIACDTGSSDAFFANSVEAIEASGAPGSAGLRNILSVPAMVEDQLTGQVTVANSDRDYTGEDLEAVRRLAALWAIALVSQEERAALLDSEASLRKSNLQYESMVYGVSEAMGRIVEARDPYTQGHEVRVARLAQLIAEKMGLPEDEIDAIEMAALVHDVGKLSVPAEILSRPGQLSSVEMDIIREHSRAGHTFLKDIVFPWPIAEIVLEHHERMDGTGYPRGLRGDDILMAARVLAVADVVEAMSSHRPYRPAVGLEAAMGELTAHPERYDKHATRACLDLYATGGLQLGVGG